MKDLLKLSLLLIVLLLWSCEKKNYSIVLSSTEWEVLKIKEEGASTFTNTEESYVFKFENDTMFSLGLDVNKCMGDYKIKTEGVISFKALPCSKVCCDSDFAESLPILFKDITSYYEKGDKLVLEGKGEIVLEKK